ncbi:MAG TPA: VanZ family protein [Thermoanaerobaculia bacterium]|nr:VanZ family protein [Thermoanaerobaculia bacterium]
MNITPRFARIALAIYLAAIYATLGVVRVITNALRDRGMLRVSVVVAFVLAAAVMLWLIFRDARNRSPRVLLTLVAVAIAYAVVIYPMKSPEEKIHFIQYGVVALLANAASPRTWSARKRFIACALFVAAAGWIDEGIQALLPSRFYDLRDVAFNAAAGLMALVALAICSPRERAVGTDRPETVAEDAAR